MEAQEAWNQTSQVKKHIADIVSNYADGSGIVAELLQNADDAGASTFKVLLDENSHSPCFSPATSHPWSGPALYAFNDEIFKPEDFDALQLIAAGTKRRDATKAGRFGIGWNSVYHITDLPSFVSGPYVTVSDPHGLYAFPPQLGGRGFLTDDAAFECFDVFGKNAPARTTVTEGVGASADSFGAKRCFYDGTLFRFPLRTATLASASEICQREVTVADMRELLSVVGGSASSFLLFLRNVECIEIFLRSPGQEPQLFYSATIASEALKLVRQSRLLFADALRECSDIDAGGDTEGVETIRTTLDYELPIDTLACDIKITENGGELKHDSCREHWIVVQSTRKQKHGLKVGDTTDPAGSMPPSLHGGAAARLDAAVTGRVYCTLPLPVVTRLPFHVNGSMSMPSNRGHVPMESHDVAADGTPLLSASGQWNLRVAEGPVTDAVLALLLRLTHSMTVDLSSTGVVSNVQRAMHFYDRYWPRRDTALSTFARAVALSVHAKSIGHELYCASQDGEHDVHWSQAWNGCFVQPTRTTGNGNGVTTDWDSKQIADDDMVWSGLRSTLCDAAGLVMIVAPEFVVRSIVDLRSDLSLLGTTAATSTTTATIFGSVGSDVDGSEPQELTASLLRSIVRDIDTTDPDAICDFAPDATSRDILLAKCSTDLAVSQRGLQPLMGLPLLATHDATVCRIGSEALAPSDDIAFALLTRSHASSLVHREQLHGDRSGLLRSATARTVLKVVDVPPFQLYALIATTPPHHPKSSSKVSSVEWDHGCVSPEWIEMFWHHIIRAHGAQWHTQNDVMSALGKLAVVPTLNEKLVLVSRVATVLSATHCGDIRGALEAAGVCFLDKSVGPFTSQALSNCVSMGGSQAILTALALCEEHTWDEADARCIVEWLGKEYAERSSESLSLAARTSIGKLAIWRRVSVSNAEHGATEPLCRLRGGLCLMLPSSDTGAAMNKLLDAVFEVAPDLKVIAAIDAKDESLLNRLQVRCISVTTVVELIWTPIACRIACAANHASQDARMRGCIGCELQTTAVNDTTARSQDFMKQYGASINDRKINAHNCESLALHIIDAIASLQRPVGGDGVDDNDGDDDEAHWSHAISLLRRMPWIVCDDGCSRSPLNLIDAGSSTNGLEASGGDENPSNRLLSLQQASDEASPPSTGDANTEYDTASRTALSEVLAAAHMSETVNSMFFPSRLASWRPKLVEVGVLDGAKSLTGGAESADLRIRFALECAKTFSRDLAGAPPPGLTVGKIRLAASLVVEMVTRAACGPRLSPAVFDRLSDFQSLSFCPPCVWGKGPAQPLGSITYRKTRTLYKLSELCDTAHTLTAGAVLPIIEARSADALRTLPPRAAEQIGWLSEPPVLSIAQNLSMLIKGRNKLVEDVGPSIALQAIAACASAIEASLHRLHQRSISALKQESQAILAALAPIDVWPTTMPVVANGAGEIEGRVGSSGLDFAPRSTIVLATGRHGPPVVFGVHPSVSKLPMLSDLLGIAAAPSENTLIFGLARLSETLGDDGALDDHQLKAVHCAIQEIANLRKSNPKYGHKPGGGAAAAHHDGDDDDDDAPVAAIYVPDIFGRLGPATQTLVHDAAWLMNRIDLTKVRVLDSGGALDVDDELLLGCTSMSRAITEELPNNFVPDVINNGDFSSKAMSWTMLLQSSEFQQCFERLLSHANGHPVFLSMEERRVLTSLRVIAVRSLPARLMYNGVVISLYDDDASNGTHSSIGSCSDILDITKSIIYLCDRRANSNMNSDSTTAMPSAATWASSARIFKFESKLTSRVLQALAGVSGRRLRINVGHLASCLEYEPQELASFLDFLCVPDRYKPRPSRLGPVRPSPATHVAQGTAVHAETHEAAPTRPTAQNAESRDRHPTASPAALPTNSASDPSTDFVIDAVQRRSNGLNPLPGQANLTAPTPVCLPPQKPTDILWRVGSVDIDKDKANDIDTVATPLWLPRDRGIDGITDTDIMDVIRFHGLLTWLLACFGVKPRDYVENGESKSVMHIYLDDSPRIAFNHNGTLWFNARVFQKLHRDDDIAANGVGAGVDTVDGQAGPLSAAASYWFVTIAHELAHNAAKGHDAQHGNTMETLIIKFMPALLMQIRDGAGGLGVGHMTDGNAVVKFSVGPDDRAPPP